MPLRAAAGGFSSCPRREAPHGSALDEPTLLLLRAQGISSTAWRIRVRDSARANRCRARVISLVHSLSCSSTLTPIHGFKRPNRDAEASSSAPLSALETTAWLTLAPAPVHSSSAGRQRNTERPHRRGRPRQRHQG